MQTVSGSGDFMGCVFFLRGSATYVELKNIFFCIHALYTFFKVWKLCHIERDLDLREETICEAYANPLPSLEQLFCVEGISFACLQRQKTEVKE